MPKKSVEESRDLVAEARARVNAEKEAARELAEAEAIVAQAEAEAAAAARKANLDNLLSQHGAAVAEYEKARDAALDQMLAYVEVAKHAADARARVEAARLSLKNQISPQGFLNAGDEAYDVEGLPLAEHLFAPGATGDANKKARVAKAGGSPEIARGLLTQPGLVV
jgi:hypothetical protein